MADDYATIHKNFDPWADIPEQYNLGTELSTRHARSGKADKVALHWENSAGSSETLTYGQLDQLSNRLAASLAELGVARGDRVFLRLPNIPQFYVSAIATAKIGAVFIPSSTQFRSEEIEYRLNDSESVAVITTTGLVEDVESVLPQCPTVKHLIVTSYPDGDVSAGQIDYASLTGPDGESKLSGWSPADTKNDDIAFIAYTSGTTGNPKGVVHYQRYPISYQSLVKYWHDYREDDVVACPAELGWLLPVASTFMYAMALGQTIVLFDSMGKPFDPVTWFRLFDTYRISNFTATPTIYRMLMAAADQSKGFDLSCWRHAVTAGEPLAEDTFEKIQENFGVAPLDGIGMSECMVYCCNMIGAEVYGGSCGRPTPGTIIELMDEDMNPVAPGEEGVLCVRRDSHPGMMKEYWNKPEQTAELFRGPWYYSGDVLRRDEHGYLWFKGRADDVIKASGYRISPFEIESCLCSHPAVLEAAAVGTPDPLRGAVVTAFIVLRSGFEGGDALAQEIQQFVRARIAPYKYPRIVNFVTSLPKTTSGKTKRRLLRDASTTTQNES